MSVLESHNNQPQIHWGILGTSMISKTMSQAILQSPSATLYAIGSRQVSKAQEFAKEFNITKSYGTYNELINDPKIHAVYIGLPNHLHKTWILKCLNAGKHVLCEIMDVCKGSPLTL